MKCPVCNGIIQIMNISNYISIKLYCTFCWNKKDLDWIEYIIGVNFEEWVLKKSQNKKGE